MIRFINLQNGAVYNGSKPYIHWFDGEQSVGLIYSQPLCIITDDDFIKVELKSDTFSLVNPQIPSEESINGFNYKNINSIKVDYLDTQATSLDNKLQFKEYNGYKICIIYILGSSNVAAEYIDELHINNEIFNIGADFYAENESLYINASNFGINIPESVQKAFYSTNILEEKKDNIILNRKFKELLSNYWDIIANKGSYKSLLNSLKWFEWGDVVRLREIWKHEDFGKTIYDDRALCSILEDKYKDTLNGFAKTSYIALYTAMQKLNIGKYDNEKNPELEEISHIWSKNDLMLKMCLLGNFYETYFMPIHLDLIHSTIEDIVFTNTFKMTSTGKISRVDHFYDVNDFTCVVNNGDDIKLTNVSVGVDPITLFANKNTLSYNTVICGVKPLLDVKDLKSDNDLKYLYTQNYNGIGAIVKVHCEIPMSSGDFIKREFLLIKFINEFQITDYKIFHENDGKVTIDFCLLVTEPTTQNNKYQMTLKFDTASGKTFIKNLTFDVIDITNATLNLYKLEKNSNLVDLNTKSRIYPSFTNIGSNEFTSYKQYLPTPSNDSGVGYNNIVVFDLLKYDLLERNVNNWIVTTANENNESNKNDYDIKYFTNSIKINHLNDHPSRYFVVLYKFDNTYIKKGEKYILEFDMNLVLKNDYNKQYITILPNIWSSNSEDKLTNNKDQIKILNNNSNHVKIELTAIEDGENNGLHQIYIPVIEGLNYFDQIIISNISLRWVPKNYIWVTKDSSVFENVETPYKYLIGISKDFKTEKCKIYDNRILNSIYRNDLGFFPEFHDLIEFGGDNLNDFEIKPNEVLCVIPTINSKDGDIDFNWRKNIEKEVWIFENVSTGEKFLYKANIQSSIIAGNYKLLTPGYYNVIFRYTLIGENNEHELILNSTFIKK